MPQLAQALGNSNSGCRNRAPTHIRKVDMGTIGPGKLLEKPYTRAPGLKMFQPPRHVDGTNVAVRAHDRTLAALDALIRFPDRHLLGDAAGRAPWPLSED